MRKLHLDDLHIESFATTPEALPQDGTVLGQEDRSTPGCPISYGGTCVISCDTRC